MTFPVVAVLVSLVLLLFTVASYDYVRRPPRLRSVAIIVLGDIGRSPRMMYHAESFAKLDFSTYFIGYRGSKPVASLVSVPHVRLCYLPEPPSFLGKVPFVLAAPIKILHQVTSILYTLMFTISCPPEFIMVQNPPSIPTLALVWLVGSLRSSKIIIDWHNLGYSILSLKLGSSHVFVKIAKWFEATFGRSAYAHLFVTRAMQDHLVSEWGLIGHKAVLHDRPPSHFHRCSPPEVHELFLRFNRLGPSLTSPSLKDYLPSPNIPYTTQFTTTTVPSSQSTQSSPYTLVNMPELREDRVALLVSSTSWTPDEDFTILLDALTQYEKRAVQVNKEKPGKLPRIWMVITGKGPLKAKYMTDVNRLEKEWTYVRCSSLWLEAEDYPLLLGSADLGICLHSSSSALDLPMKVVDMFGCGLPVCALDFASLPELVRNGVNGLIFRNAGELANQLETLLTSFPNAGALRDLRSSLLLASQTRASHLVRHQESTDWEWGTWADNWSRVVRPLVLKDVERFE